MQKVHDFRIKFPEMLMVKEIGFESVSFACSILYNASPAQPRAAQRARRAPRCQAFLAAPLLSLDADLALALALLLAIQLLRPQAPRRFEAAQKLAKFPSRWFEV